MYLTARWSYDVLLRQLRNSNAPTHFGNLLVRKSYTPYICMYNMLARLELRIKLKIFNK